LIQETVMGDTTSSPCPECATDVRAPENARPGEIAACSGCSTELEVIAVAPIQFAVAPEVEEDWGE